MFCLCYVAPHSQIQVFRYCCDCWVNVLQTEVLFIQLDWLYWQWVDRTFVCWKDHQIPCVFFHLKNAYFTLTSSRIQFDSISCRCPLHMINGAFMMLMLCDFYPFEIPNLEHAYFLLKTSDSNQLSELGIGPGDFPDGSLISEWRKKYPLKDEDLTKVSWFLA